MKIIRIIISIIFFTLYFFLFLRLLEISNILSNILPVLQIFPGIFKFITAFSISSIIILFILALSAFFGRWYCSLICPLGTLQDFFIFIKKKFFKKMIFRYHKPLFYFHYGFFAIYIIIFILGMNFFFIYFEPFSVFGRITTNLFRPVLNLINNNISYIFNHAGLTFLKPMTDYYPGIPVLVYSAVFFALIGFLSFFRGRIYCNLLCPTGAVLSILSRTQIFKFRINKEHCLKCGLCTGICRSECIDTVNKSIDSYRCVSCMDCMDVCPVKAITYGFPQKIKNFQPENKSTNSRREFIKTSIKTSSIIILILLLPRFINASVYSKFLPFKKKKR